MKLSNFFRFEWYVTAKTFKETPQLKTYEWVRSFFKLISFRRDKDINHETQVKCGEGLLYVPTVENVNRLLRVVCTPILNGNVGVPGETYNTNLISAGPGFCPFEIRHQVIKMRYDNFIKKDNSNQFFFQFTPNFLPENEVRVLTYNLLADLYADSDFSRETLHPQCPPYALDMEYR